MPPSYRPAINPALTNEVRQLCTEKGWRTSVTGAREGYEFPAYIALAHSELSEALEAYRIKQWSDTLPPTLEDDEREADTPGKPVGVGPELADVIIRIIDMADIWNIDLDYEIKRVLEYGWTRPYQHGGKTL